MKQTAAKPPWKQLEDAGGRFFGVHVSAMAEQTINSISGLSCDSHWCSERTASRSCQCVHRKNRWAAASRGVRQIQEIEFLQLWCIWWEMEKETKKETIWKRDVFWGHLQLTWNARHCCKQLKDTIPSWKKDFVANHFCHNAAHSPNIHCICAALKRREKRISKKKKKKKNATSQQEKFRSVFLVSISVYESLVFFKRGSLCCRCLYSRGTHLCIVNQQHFNSNKQSTLVFLCLLVFTVMNSSLFPSLGQNVLHNINKTAARGLVYIF